MTTVQAHIAFIRTEDGGKTQTVFSGYRPQFYFSGEDFDCNVNLVACDELSPGEAGAVEIMLSLVASEAIGGRLICGSIFQLREGDRVVAGGVLIGRKDSRFQTDPPTGSLD